MTKTKTHFVWLQLNLNGWNETRLWQKWDFLKVVTFINNDSYINRHSVEVVITVVFYIVQILFLLLFVIVAMVGRWRLVIVE